VKFDAVFEGGGVKGIGLVGALAHLESQGYEPVNLAGTSAGAIVATLRAAGYLPDELKSQINGIDFRKMEDATVIGGIPFAGQAIDLFTRLGVYKGDYLLDLMRELLGRKGKKTFGDLVIAEYADQPQYRYGVRVVASDVTSGAMVVLPQDLKNYGRNPDDFEVAMAVRMSMSIPYFFRPARLKAATGGEHVIVDGGVLSNFPVELFDTAGEPEWPTFGFRLGAQPTPAADRYQVRGPISLLRAMFGTMMEAHDDRYVETHKFVRSIMIDPVGISTIQFDLGPDEKEKLYQSGVTAARDFLSRWDFEAYKAQFRSGKEPPTRRDLVVAAGTSRP
jgi:NTE family protein